MSWKILVTARPFDTSSDNGKRMLKEGGCEVVMTTHPTPLTHDTLREELPGVDAVIAGSDDFSEATLSLPEAAELKLVTRWGVGYDAIDIVAATKLGIVVGFLPGFLDHAVAEGFLRLGHRDLLHVADDPATLLDELLSRPS